jgi:CheY-like chemotaxis protein
MQDSAGKQEAKVLHRSSNPNFEHYALYYSTSDRSDLMLMPRAARILVADDERIIADTLALILIRSGYEAAAVYNGIQAVEKAMHWPPDLFLGDVHMPELNGIQAATAICTKFPACRVLLFSAEASSRVLVHETRFLGHNFEFVEKPISPIDLLSRIRRLRVA